MKAPWPTWCHLPLHYRAQYGVTYHSVMPTNLYGAGDNYDPMNAHVLPALLRRFHGAREQGAPQITVWGSACTAPRAGSCRCQNGFVS